MDLETLKSKVGSGPLQVDIISAILGNTADKTLIDLCCGEVAALRHLTFARSIHVDITDLPLRPRKLRFVNANVLGDDPVFNDHYDIAACLDGIEHLTKPDGHKLIQRMNVIADRSIIFTPLGDMWLGKEGETDPMVHKSGWTPADFADYPQWSTLVFPNWHLGWKFGGLFAWSGLDNQAVAARLSRIK